MAFVEKDISLRSGDLKYFVAGEGVPLVYLHAAGGVRLTAALEDLADGFAVYCPVIPGFDGTGTHAGVDSMTALAELCGEFADVAIGQRVVMGGQAFGAWAAAWTAILRPELVAALVLESPNGLRPADAEPPSTDPALMRKQMYAHPENLPPETKTRETLIQNSKVQHHYDRRALRDEALVARLGDIVSPTLVLYGLLDGRNPKATAELARSGIKGAQLLCFEDCAHNVEVDQRERFVSAVRSFLAPIAGESAGRGSGAGTS